MLQQLLDADVQERKQLDFDDLAQVIQYSDTNPAVTLKFLSAQRPYQIEFLRSSERNEFLNMLRTHLKAELFQARIPPAMDFDNKIKPADFEIVDVPSPLLPLFYQGLALKMTLQLDRARTECIRISRLKALSDTDSLMLLFGT